MEKYFFMALGVILGIAISMYVYSIKKEHVAKMIKKDQENFSTEKLDSALKNAVKEMQKQMNLYKRTLTEDEKNEIIFGNLNNQKSADIKKIENNADIR